MPAIMHSNFFIYLELNWVKIMTETFMQLNVIRKKPLICQLCNTNSILWRFYNIKIWWDLLKWEKMQPIKEKIKQATSALPLYLNMLEEESYLILLLKLGSFLKKSQELTSIKWWMVSILCIRKVMLIETLNLKIF